jgi:hypothetical protein
MEFVVIIIMGLVIWLVILVLQDVAEWISNNTKPVLSEAVRVVAKRSDTSGAMSSSGGAVVTSYFVTFESDRKSLVVGLTKETQQSGKDSTPNLFCLRT